MLLTPARTRPAYQLRQYQPHDATSELYPDDPAYRAVIDFRFDAPITVPADYPVEAALADMHRLRVHALLVTREEPDSSEPHFVGLVTQHELVQPHALQAGVPSAPDGSGHTCVADVMTPVEELSVARYASLRDLTVLDVHEMFQGTGLSHLVVVDADGSDFGVARGLISRARLARRLRGSL
jgi:CBS domain-containing protein